MRSVGGRHGLPAEDGENGIDEVRNKYQLMVSLASGIM